MHVMNIREYLLQNNLSYRKAAKAWGISHSIIHYWVYKKTNPKQKYKDLIKQVTRGQVKL